MKKFLFSFGFMSLALLSFGQSQRTVLVEEFTQASCPPCETTTPALNAILETNEAKVVQIRYQTSWPGVDPMNADNPDDVQARVDFYGVTGVPDVRADGTFTGNGVITQAEIDNRYGMTSPVLMTMTHQLNADLSGIDVTLTIENEGTADFDPAGHKLRVAVVEEEINWPFRPGSTSLVDFEYVMKSFLTGVAGEDLAVVPGGMSMDMTWSADLPTTIYNYNKIGVVAWIQNETNQDVVQSTESHAYELSGYPDLGIVNTATAGGGLCDLAYTPSVTVTNDSDLDVTDYTVALVINGAEVASENYTTALAANSSTDITMPEITLGAGTSSIAYTVVANGVSDINILNNQTQASAVSKAGLEQDVLAKDFESAEVGFQPSDMLLDMPIPIFVVDGPVLQSTQTLGGFGDSDVSVRVNFYQWNPASLPPTGSMTVGDQLKVESDFAALNFDYAFTTWGGSNDQLDIQISSDCGETFTSVWSKSGGDLATAPELNENAQAFIPTPTQWATESVDISDYVGETVLVRFFFTSAWGDMMYIDNINAVGVSDVDVVQLENTLSVFPNPTSDVANVSMNMDEAADVNISIVDQLGRRVTTQNFGNLNGQVDLSMDVSALNAGMYLVQIQLDDQVVTRKLTIE